MTLAHEIGELDPDFEELAIRWRESRLVRRLQRLQMTSERRIKNRRADLRYLRSLTTVRELWACSYAQWAALKCDYLPLKIELERQIQLTGLILGESYSTQWELDDFKGIMDAVDNLFRKRGWI